MVPVLWIAGPPGVGKTTVAWQIWSRLNAAAYVDIDQLGMCVPAPDDDPDRVVLKATNLAAIVPNYLAAGARFIVVSGVTDAEQARAHADLVADASVKLVQLRLDPKELTDRLADRGWSEELVSEALAEAEMLDEKFVGDITIDTTGMTVGEVVRAVQDRLGPWGEDAAFTVPQPPLFTAPVLWLCGASGVGKSTIGWEAFTHFQRSGVPKAYLDLEQIGFLRPSVDGNHRIRAANLASIGANFQAAGCQRLVVAGGVETEEQISHYRQALPGATITLVRLHAGRDRLLERVMRLGRGESWREPGDRYLGRDAATLQRIAEAAFEEAERLEHHGIGDACVYTDTESTEEITRRVLAIA